MLINGQMYFTVEPPFCPTLLLIAASGTGCMRMDFAMSGIYHQPFKTLFLYKYFKQFFTNPFISPANEALMDCSPFAIFRRKIAPWCSNA